MLDFLVSFDLILMLAFARGSCFSAFFLFEPVKNEESLERRQSDETVEAEQGVLRVEEEGSQVVCSKEEPGRTLSVLLSLDGLLDDLILFENFLLDEYCWEDFEL